MRLTITLLFVAVAQLMNAQHSKLIISKYNDLPANLNVNCMEVDTNNTLYIGGNTGIHVLNQNNGTSRQLLTGKNILQMVLTAGELWAIDEKNLYQVSGMGKTYGMMDDENVFTSLVNYKGKMYCGTKNGLYMLNKQSGKFEISNTRNSKLLSNSIKVTYADSKGRLWIGTENGEVRVENDEWKSYHEGKEIQNVFENKEGLWFIAKDSKTNKQEMWLVDHYNREFDAGFGPDLYRGTFNDFCIDSNGKLYFASDAFIRYDPYEEKTVNFIDKAGLLSSKCTSTLCDKHDVIWIGTENEGLFRLVFDDSKQKVEVQPLSIICLVEKNVSCSGQNDGSVKAIATGGEGDYTYKWNLNNATGSSVKNLAPGSYEVLVTDKANNTSTCVVDLPSPTALGIELINMTVVKSLNGKDGSLQVAGKGGSGDYKYKWGNGSSKSTLDKLAAGIYNITITDKNKCTAEASFELTREKILPDLTLSNIKVGQTLRINELYFRADSTEISLESNTVLEEIFTFLQSNPSIAVEIGGHTNTIPPHDYCDKLSTERAKSVANYFYNKGIAENRMSYKGYGKRQALTNDTSLEGRRRNQRVEIKIISI